jgi:photosystem II stability/assembly factor-like uncharacterized protein
MFELDSVPPGTYEITVAASGYMNIVDSVKIVAGALAHFDRTMHASAQAITGWKNVSTTSITNDLTCVSCVNPSLYFAAGFSGTVIRSTDGGATWSTLPAPGTENLYAVHFIDTNRGVVLGNTGASYYTTNGGRSWQDQRNNYYRYTYRNASFTDPMNGVAVGSDGMGGGGVVQTTDGGASWTDRTGIFTTPPGVSPLYGVGFASPTVGCVVGVNASIYTTTNPSNDWKTVNSGMVGTFFSAAMPDPQTITIVGDNGVIYHSTNFGALWSPQISPYNSRLSAVAFADANHGIIAGFANVILYTINGGANWVDMSSGSTDYYGVAMSDQFHAVVVGKGGAIVTSVVQ